MIPRSDSYWDAMRQCEAPGGCSEAFDLKLVPVVEADGERSHHWFCELHAPKD